jgi:hypothetical protein
MKTNASAARTMALMIAAIGGLLLFSAGCATDGATQTSTTANSVQSSSGPTVSGYLDVGAGKSFH